MFVLKLFDRTLSQVIAPDANAPEHSEAEDDLWQVLAPDSNYTRGGGPPQTSTFTNSTPANAAGNQLECTPPNVGFESPEASLLSTIKVPNSCSSIIAQPSLTPPNMPLTTPSRRYPPTMISDAVKDQVLQSALGLAHAMASPPAAMQMERTVFQFCCNTSQQKGREMNKKYEKSLQRVRAILLNNPAVFFAQASRMGDAPPDGYTPLMAAAYCNNVAAAEVLWECGKPEQLLARNLQGKTPYHIASEMGHLEMIQFLKPLYETHVGGNMPLDLLGITPYGSAITSPQPKARQNQRKIHELLYSEKDLSILGSPAPVQHRVAVDGRLAIAYGYADQPGHRVWMEDAMTIQGWDTAALLAVCDGHGDGGRVSQFIADQLPTVFQEEVVLTTSRDISQPWTKRITELCLSLDKKLQASSLAGGTTAIIAYITTEEIIVANIGDSRCILVHTADIVQQMENTSLNDDADMTTAITTRTSGGTKYHVQALSQDHKPSDDTEKSRIVAAGLTVIEERFVEKDGNERVLHKIRKDSENSLATSRAFGDFEYKSNKQLPVDQQAVIAVPDVTIHRRQPDTDSYLVLACDGIWDVMTNEEVGSFIVEYVQQNQEATLSVVADLLLAECLRRGSTDNMSVIVVALSKAAEKFSSTMPERKILRFD